MISDTWKKLQKSIDRNLKYNWKRFYQHKNSTFYVRNHDDASVFFPAIELKIAMKTWDILKATYLIASLHIWNEHTAYLFEMCARLAQLVRSLTTNQYYLQVDWRKFEIKLGVNDLQANQLVFTRGLVTGLLLQYQEFVTSK